MLSKIFSNKKIIILFLSLIPLAIVYISEYFFEILPCKLCIYQRIPYVIVGVITIVNIIKLFRNVLNKIINLTIEILLIINFSIAIFHYGIERRFFRFQSNCLNNLGDAENFEDYKKMLANQDYILCDQVSYEFFGVPISIWNAIYAFFFFLLVIKFNKNGDLK